MKDNDIFRVAPLNTAEEAEQWTKAMTVGEGREIGAEFEGTVEVTCYDCLFFIRGDGENFGGVVKVTAYHDALGGYWIKDINWASVAHKGQDAFQDDSLRQLLEELLGGMFERADDGMELEIFAHPHNASEGVYLSRKYSLDTMQAVED